MYLFSYFAVTVLAVIDSCQVPKSYYLVMNCCQIFLVSIVSSDWVII